MISDIVDRNMKSGFGSGGWLCCVLSCVVLILLTGRVPVRLRSDPSLYILHYEEVIVMARRSLKILEFPICKQLLCFFG